MKKTGLFVLVITGILLAIAFSGCTRTEKPASGTKEGTSLHELSGGGSVGPGGGDGNGNGGDGNGNGGDGPAGTVTLTFWHTFEHGKEVELINKLARDFEREHPNIRINVQGQTYNGAVEKFITAASGGEAPDIIRLPNDRLGSVASMGLVADITQYVSPGLRDSYVSLAINGMKYDGKYYGLPASYDCMALIYNKDYVDTPPTTTDELITLGKQLTRGDRYGLAFPLKVPYWYFPFQAGFGGTIFDEAGNPKIYTDESMNAAEFMFNLEKVYGILPAGGIDENLMASLFTEQKAAMIISGPWLIADIEAADINYGVAPLPKVTATGLDLKPLIGVKGYAISQQSKHKDEAFIFIQYLTSQAVTVDFAQATNTLPSVKAAYQEQSVKDNAVITSFNAQVQRGQLAPTRPEMSAVWGPTTDALESYYTGKKTLDKAFQDAQQAIEEQISS